MHKSGRGVCLLLTLLVLTACAAYTPPPLTTVHPAHPEAATAPEPAASHTLAYSPSDRPSPAPAVAMTQLAAAEGQASDAGKHAVVGEGNVIALAPSSQQIVVDHKEIKGFMDAMTMGYRVDPPSIMEGLNAGDRIRFTIDTRKNAIVKMAQVSQKTFEGEGKVVAVVPNTQQLIIDHGDIKGFMDAMTMGFKVDQPALLEGVQPGDKIRFIIGAPQNAIIQIEKLNP